MEVIINTEFSKYLIIATLSTEINGKIYSKTHQKARTKESKNHSEVKGILLACRHLKQDKELKILINTSNTYISTCIKNLDKWQQAGWVTSKGKEVKHKKEWQEIYELTKNFELTVKSGCDVAKAEVAPVQQEGVRDEEIDNK